MKSVIVYAGCTSYTQGYKLFPISSDFYLCLTEDKTILSPPSMQLKKSDAILQRPSNAREARASVYPYNICVTVHPTVQTVMMKTHAFVLQVTLAYSDIVTFTQQCISIVISFVHTAKRPPVEETAAFLRTLLENHGANYLEKLFGSNARNALLPLGGPEKVAIALSGNESSPLSPPSLPVVCVDFQF